LADPTTDFTLFAPTNAAFQALPLRLKRKLFFSSNLFVAQFEDLLLYHCLDGGRKIGDFSNGKIESLNNENLLFRTAGTLLINGSIRISDPDEILANGITHKIDGALTPRWVSTTIFDVVSDNDNADLSTFKDLIERAGLDFDSDPNLLSPRTLLGPTNAAFEALDPAKLESLRDSTNKAELVRILNYHTIEPAVLTQRNLRDSQFLETTSAQTILVSVNGPTIKFNQATAQGESILTNNGAFIKIDKVLNPDNAGGF
jgi:uncharacterized surface protein with fasciclin (FAS1) repeats